MQSYTTQKWPLRKKKPTQQMCTQTDRLDVFIRDASLKLERNTKHTTQNATIFHFSLDRSHQYMIVTFNVRYWFGFRFEFEYELRYASMAQKIELDSNWARPYKKTYDNH